MKKKQSKPFIARFFERAMREDNYDEKNFKWVNGEYECPIIRAMFLGYKLAQKDHLNHTHGHFIIGKVVDSKPYLSNTPKIHRRFGQAMNEVTRLAEDNKDTKFIIYNSVIVRENRSDYESPESKVVEEVAVE